MQRRASVLRAVVGCLVFAQVVANGIPAAAVIVPVRRDDELVGFANVIVTAEVIRVRSRWDDAVGGIYTYVTVRIEEVLKGNVSRRRITLKQLGGRVTNPLPLQDFVRRAWQWGGAGYRLTATTGTSVWLSDSRPSTSAAVPSRPSRSCRSTTLVQRDAPLLALPSALGSVQ